MHVSIKQSKEIVKTWYKMPLGEQKQTLFLVGAPGIGKTESIYQCADELTKELGFPVNRGAQSLAMSDPTDIKGLPLLTNEGVKWLVSRNLPRDGHWIYLFDDFNQAPMAVQNACNRLLREGRLEDYTKPEHCLFVCAGNKEEHKAGTHRMGTATQTRFVFLEVRPNVDDWGEWATGNGITPVVIAYLRRNPSAFYDFKPEQKNFPTPRGWEAVSTVVKYFTKDEDLPALLEGAIGEGGAANFLAFYEVRGKLPDLVAILAGEDIIPDNVDALAITCASLIALFKVEAKQVKRRAYANRLVSYALFLTEHKEVEYGVLMVRDLVLLDQKLATTAPTWKKFCDKNAEVIRG